MFLKISGGKLVRLLPWLRACVRIWLVDIFAPELAFIRGDGARAEGVLTSHVRDTSRTKKFRRLGGLAPQTKFQAPQIQTWNTSNQWRFGQFSECQTTRTNVKHSCWRLSGDGSGTRYDATLLKRSINQARPLTGVCVGPIHTKTSQR